MRVNSVQWKMLRILYKLELIEMASGIQYDEDGMVEVLLGVSQQIRKNI